MFAVDGSFDRPTVRTRGHAEMVVYKIPVMFTSGCEFRLMVESVLAFGLFFFFFSSRRRHTRFDCDWSSDVCSDLARATPEFDVVAAREIVLAVKFPPWYVHVHSADAVVIVRWNFLQRRDVAVAVTTDGVGEVSADSAGGVSDTVWKGGGFGVQQEARGFAGACSHDNRARVYALFRTRRFINIGDALGSAVFADKNLAGHRPGNQRQLPRFHGRREQDLAGAEIRRGGAAAPALAAVVTWQPAIHRFRQNREPRRNASNVELVTRFLDQDVRTARLRRREKNTIGCARNIFFRSKYANVSFGFVVIGREVFVGNRPVVAETVARAGFEVDGSKPQGNAAPMIGTATDDARAEPLEICARRRGIGLAINLPGPVGREELAEILPRCSAHAGAAVRQFVRPHEHLEAFFGSDVRPGFQQGAVQAALGENLRRHASAGAGADDAYIVRFWRPDHLGHSTLSPYRLFFLISETAKSQARAVNAM